MTVLTLTLIPHPTDPTLAWIGELQYRNTYIGPWLPLAQAEALVRLAAERDEARQQRDDRHRNERGLQGENYRLRQKNSDLMADLRIARRSTSSSEDDLTTLSAERDLYKSRWLSCVTPEEAERLRAERDEAQLERDTALTDTHDEIMDLRAENTTLRTQLDAALARVGELEKEQTLHIGWLKSVVAMLDHSMSGARHRNGSVFVPGVSDLELRPDGSLTLNVLRNAITEAALATAAKELKE